MMEAIFIRRAALFFALLFAGTPFLQAGGITADVGLTPPKDRYIFRTQLRWMEMGNDPTTMNREATMYGVPMVLAYGLQPNVTLIGRQVAFHRRMKMPSGVKESTGLGDFALISKWRLLRINKPEYIIGLAPVLGIELPTGDDDFSSDTFDLLTGAFLTIRRGEWGADLNLEYVLNGFDDRDDRLGDAFTANLALSYQFTLDEQATVSVWPVLELTWSESWGARMGGSGVANTGGSIATVAPGIRFARQSFMLEALVQFPFHNRQSGTQLETEVSGLIGLRYLF